MSLRSGLLFFSNQLVFIGKSGKNLHGQTVQGPGAV